MALTISLLPLNNFVSNGKFNILLGSLVIHKVKLYTNNSKNKWINSNGRRNMGLNKKQPQPLINMALFILNFLKTDGKGNIAAHKYQVAYSGCTRFPLVT